MSPAPLVSMTVCGGHREGRQDALGAGLVVPEQAALAHGDAADPAAAALEIGEHLGGGEVHLLAEPLGDDGDIDEFQQFVSVGAQAAAVERGQDAGLAADPGVMHRGVGLVPVEMQGAAAVDIQAAARDAGNDRRGSARSRAFRHAA